MASQLFQNLFRCQAVDFCVLFEALNVRLKKFRVMGEEFRNRLKHYDAMTDIVSGLVNFRIMGTTTA